MNSEIGILLSVYFDGKRLVAFAIESAVSFPSMGVERIENNLAFLVDDQNIKLKFFPSYYQSRSNKSGHDSWMWDGGFLTVLK